MSNPVPFPGPIPPFSNPPIHPEFYEPSQFFISNITLGPTTIVTTTADHNYVIGQLVRILIPRITVQINPPNGPFRQVQSCYELNERSGYVIDIPSSTEVTLDINSFGITPFISSSEPTQPQILAIGDINSGINNNSGNLNTGTSILGSFINISPL